MADPEDLDRWMTAVRDHDDQEAYARVCEASQHLVRAIMLRDTADAELADELAQETLVKGWEKRAQYRPGTSPRAWLLAIARSRLMDHHRRQDRDRRHLKDLVKTELVRRAPRHDAVDEARIEALRACVAELRDDQRELLDLIHNQGLGSDETAEILGIKGPACRQRLSRLQRVLRECAEARLAQ